MIQVDLGEYLEKDSLGAVVGRGIWVLVFKRKLIRNGLKEHRRAKQDRVERTRINAWIGYGPRTTGVEDLDLT